MRDQLLAFGHQFPSPGGGSSYLGDDGLKGLMGELHDDVNGGWYAGLTADGEILPNKACYVHTFVILVASFAVLAGGSGAKRLLEEAMSELMAKNMKIPLFASNDEGAKKIAHAKFNSDRYVLDVKTITELLSEIGVRENKLAWRDIKVVLREPRWNKQKKELWSLWNEN